MMVVFKVYHWSY